jgi:hypothetical protein
VLPLHHNPIAGAKIRFVKNCAKCIFLSFFLCGPPSKYLPAGIGWQWILGNFNYKYMMRSIKILLPLVFLAGSAITKAAEPLYNEGIKLKNSHKAQQMADELKTLSSKNAAGLQEKVNKM